MNAKKLALIAASAIAAFVPPFCGLGPEQACAADVSIGGFDIAYGKIGENAFLDFVSPELFNKNENVEELRDRLTITHDFDPDQKREIELGVAYISDIFAKNTPAANALIHVGFASNPNGSALSLSPAGYLADSVTTGISPNGTVYDKFIHARTSPYPAGLADNIIIFNMDFGAAPSRLLLQDGDMATMVHEMGHAMGIMGTSAVLNPNENGVGTQGRFDREIFTSWNNHLHDVFGTRARPDMLIEVNVTDNASVNNPNVFQLYAQNGSVADFKYPTFRGDNVNALTGGKGMPVMGALSNAGPGLDGANSLGHPGVVQSLMSYGIIRNMAFSEMELAAFQDMGYEMDRSRFFGKSFYYDVGGNVQTNTNGYDSDAILGVGAHIMRDNLTLTQEANLNASGYGGGGIRVDGVGNTVIIPENTAVTANGERGTGLLVSYGSGNVVKLDGTLAATGSEGIGAHFGIKAANGPAIRSYMNRPALPPNIPIQTQYEYLKAARDLNGALAERLDISGTLAGSQAAVRIEADAHVREINVSAGAVVAGDVKSAWSRNALNGREYGTTITFGKAGSAGVARLAGDIVWEKDGSFYYGVTPTNSLDVVVAGGVFAFDGNASVNSWKVENGATFRPTVSTAGISKIVVGNGAFDVRPGARLELGGLSALPAGDYAYARAVAARPAAPLPASFILANPLVERGAYLANGGGYDFALTGLKDMAPVLHVDPFYDQLRLAEAMPYADRTLFDNVYNTGEMSGELAGYFSDIAPLANANAQTAAASQAAKSFLVSAFDAIWNNPLRQRQANAAFATASETAASDDALASPCFEPAASAGRGLTAWVHSGHKWSSRSSSASAAGYSFRPTDFSVGLDYSRGPWTLGAAFQYGFGKVKTDAAASGRRHENKVDSYLGALYAGYFTPDFYIRGGVAYARTKQDLHTRYGRGDTAAAKYWSDSFGADVEFGRRFQFCSGLGLTPHIGLAYSFIRTPGYSENGSGYARSFGSSDWNVFELPAGIRLDKQLGGKLAASLDLAYVPNLGKRSAETRVAFVSAPAGSGWTAVDPSASRHAFAGKAAIDWKPNERAVVSLGYNLHLSRRTRTHTASLAAGLSF